MNKERRKKLAKALELMQEADAILEEVKEEEEEEAFDNLPESIQDSDRGETMQGYIETIDDTRDYLSDAVDTLADQLEG